MYHHTHESYTVIRTYAKRLMEFVICTQTKLYTTGLYTYAPTPILLISTSSTGNTTCENVKLKQPRLHSRIVGARKFKGCCRPLNFGNARKVIESFSPGTLSSSGKLPNYSSTPNQFKWRPPEYQHHT